MKILSHTDTLKELAKATKRPCIYLNFSPWDSIGIEEVVKAAPYLSLDDDGQAILDGCAFIVCKNYEEMQKLYDLTVGDDGPTKSNPYKGPYTIYALTCNADGQCENENT